MTTLRTGGNVQLPSEALSIHVRAAVSGADVDASAFLLRGDGKIREDLDFVFYNQPRSARGELTFSKPSAEEVVFEFDPAAAPPDVERIALAVAVDGTETLADATRLEVEVPGVVTYAPERSARRALILAELYRRGEGWKLRAVGQGFDGGLGPLAQSFGVELADEPAEAPLEDASKTRLEKRLVDLEKRAPELVSLVKQVQVSLEKKQVRHDRAKVALCLDISASMDSLYKSGKIDLLLKRVMALGYRFDDDGAIDVFLFGARAHTYGEVDVETYSRFVRTMLDQFRLEAGTRYGEAMKRILAHYEDDLRAKKRPVYVMFVTDGNTADEAVTEAKLRESSALPIFWQFMAIGKKPSGQKKRGFFSRLVGAGFDFLERLDDLEGRTLDNSDFFLVEDPAEPSDEEMFDLMMTEYPSWLEAAASRGLLGSSA